MLRVRLRQVSLLLLAMVISFLAFFQMFERTENDFPANYAGMLILVAVLFLVLWGLIIKFQPYASQSILPSVLMLTTIGTVMIARIDQANGTSTGFRQLVWLCLALVLCGAVIVALQDYRILR